MYAKKCMFLEHRFKGQSVVDVSWIVVKRCVCGRANILLIGACVQVQSSVAVGTPDYISPEILRVSLTCLIMTSNMALPHTFT